MTAIAVLGTGDLGAAMCRCLTRAGFEVRSWNRTRKRADPLADAGVRVCDSAADAASGADVLMTVLSTGAVVESVAEEALSRLAPGAIWIQVATVGTDAVDALVRLAETHGVPMFDAPMSGGDEDAEAGHLAVLASGPGDDPARATAQRVFDVIGRKTVWAGAVSDGTRLKLVVNTWPMTMLEGLSEAIALAEGLEINPHLLLETLAGGPLDVPYAQAKGSAMIDRSYEAHSALDLGGKDMRLARSAVEELGLDIPLPGLIAQRIARNVAAGYGRQDQASLVEVARGS